MRSTRPTTSAWRRNGRQRSRRTSAWRASTTRPSVAPAANASAVASAAPATPSAGRPKWPKMSAYAATTFTTPTTAPIASGVRVSPAPRSHDTMTKRVAPAGTPPTTMRTNGVPTATTAASTRNAAISAGAHAKTGITASVESAAAATIDCRSVSSAARRSAAPTCRATIASAPVPTAKSIESTAPSICTPTPTAATAVAPRRPTISVSQRPTNDSIENEKMTGHASAHVARRRLVVEPVASGTSRANVLMDPAFLAHRGARINARRPPAFSRASIAGGGDRLQPGRLQAWASLTPSRRHRRALVLVALLLVAVPGSVAPQVHDWDRFGFDAARTNAGPRKTGITAANVARIVQQQVALDGTADSSPIYLAGVTAGGGVHDVFVV